MQNTLFRYNEIRNVGKLYISGNLGRIFKGKLENHALKK